MSEGLTRRARSPEARQDRRAAILAAAAELFASHAYEDVHMAGVAAKAGLAKGTLYLYFSTKESLFLGLLLELLEAWASALEAALLQARSPDEVAATLADSLEASPALVRLLSLLHASLERHADADSVVAFKQRLGALVLRTGGRLAAALGWPPEEGARLLLHTSALVIGIAPMGRPPPAVAAALARPDLAWMVLDASLELRRAIRAWIRGHGAEAALSPPS